MKPYYIEYIHGDEPVLRTYVYTPPFETDKIEALGMDVYEHRWLRCNLYLSAIEVYYIQEANIFTDPDAEATEIWFVNLESGLPQELIVAVPFDKFEEMFEEFLLDHIKKNNEDDE